MSIRELFKKFGELFKELIDFIMEVMTLVLYLLGKIINFFLDAPITTLFMWFFIIVLMPGLIIGIIDILIEKIKKLKKIKKRREDFEK